MRYDSLARSARMFSMVLIIQSVLMGIDSCGTSLDDDGDGVPEDEGDCDDSDPTSYPGAPELCDLRDNDCNGILDDLEVHSYYFDSDGDGFGGARTATPFSGCESLPAGYVESGADCDDTDASIFPATTADGTASDSDCDGEIDMLVRFAGISWVDTDGHQVIDVPLPTPEDIEPEGQGGFYLTLNHTIRYIDPAGVITTVAGTGVRGHTGDGGPATAASLARPAGMALDGQGNLFVADSEANRVRLIETDGIITTVAGDGTPAFGGDGSAATSAQLYQPQAVAFGPFGDLFISDRLNRAIRRVAPDGVISTIAHDPGTSTIAEDGPALASTIGEPYGLAVEASGVVLFVDRYHQVVRAVYPDGAMRTIAGSDGTHTGDTPGAARTTRLTSPEWVFVDPQGRILIADSGANIVWELVK